MPSNDPGPGEITAYGAIDDGEGIVGHPIADGEQATDPSMNSEGARNGADNKDGDDWPFLDASANGRSADQHLLTLMRDNPGATIARLAALSGLPRLAISLSLKRLERAGLADHASRGSWVAVDADLVGHGSPQSTNEASWVKPLSGKHVARFTADGRIREETLTP